jgi:hypothetical protein
MSDERLKLTVTMEVTVPQALTLKAMFEYWNRLGRIGASRYVAFYCDGDGNFRPECLVSTDRAVPGLTDAIRKKSVVDDHDGDRKYDFDPVAWLLHD